jgi:hypothetical protein
MSIERLYPVVEVPISFCDVLRRNTTFTGSFFVEYCKIASWLAQEEL